jgi:hypothetical protein
MKDQRVVSHAEHEHGSRPRCCWRPSLLALTRALAAAEYFAW